MLPFLWNTVHTTKYEIVGASDMPILLRTLTRLGTQIKHGNVSTGVSTN
jgi:hypothetical protein